MNERKEPQGGVLPLPQLHAYVSSNEKPQVFTKERRLVQKVRTECRTPVVARTIKTAFKRIGKTFCCENRKEKIMSREYALDECKTVEEVEKLCCYDCANNHHFGWCDVEGIICPAKSRIKEITGEHGHSMTLEEHINKILERAEP